MKIVIPTADRPHSLRSVLDYYARFYPRADLVVADGSGAEARELNRTTVRQSALTVDYRAYDASLPVFERLLSVVNDLDSEYVVMGADDNYPVLETLEKARKRMADRPDAVCAGGHIIHLSVVAPDRATATLEVVRHVNADDPAQRMRVFGSLPFPSSYGVARRELVVERLEFLRSWYLKGFYALGVGLMAMAKGKYVAVPEPGFILTSNYVDDTAPAEEPLACLRGADLVLAMHDAVLERASTEPGFDEVRTRDVLSAVIGRRVAALAGAPALQLVGFTDKAPYRTPMVEGARQLFSDLFTEGTPTRAAYADRLAFIAERLQQATDSDNRLEAGAV
ncbi:TIGR00180 family glycosyltransferase [Nocardioides antri]|uniref:TIGR00180 family glycosyltransferase n=1 Tax=Nocardioides antri TaxID=2607659 RepID=A0A5B1M660_9ACTN|nr:TIGR00180 family glycosyltransferase [Nocardioides antri]KAA1427277.1 TIGR00180 family glycosyltransferase [Nocardioides antri]